MNLRQLKRRLVTIEPEALMRAGVAGALLIDDAFFGGAAALLTEDPGSEEPQDLTGVVRVMGPLHQRAAVIDCAYVDGYDAVSSRFEAALADARTSSVLLVIDSPGGVAAGLESAIQRMMASKARHDKSVVAYIDESAASAAYWIATVADEIVVPVAGKVGSIGCVTGWVDQSKAWAKLGIEWHIIREPAGKQENNPLAPLADLADARAREVAKGYAGRFIDAVATARGVDAKVIRALNAAMFEGQKAVDEKLADSVGTLESAASRATELGKKRRTTRNKDKAMSKLTAMVAVFVGLAADASPEAVEVALEQKTKDLEESTGATTLAGAIAKHDALKITSKTATDRLAAIDAAAEAKKIADAEAKKQSTDGAFAAAVLDGRVSPARKVELEAKRVQHGDDWLLAVLAELKPTTLGSDGEVKLIAGPDTSKPAVSSELKTLLAKLGLTEADHQAAMAAGGV